MREQGEEQWSWKHWIDLLDPSQVLHLISFLFYILVPNSNYIYNSHQQKHVRWKYHYMFHLRNFILHWLDKGWLVLDFFLSGHSWNNALMVHATTRPCRLHRTISGIQPRDLRANTCFACFQWSLLSTVYLWEQKRTTFVVSISFQVKSFFLHELTLINSSSQ